MKTDSLKILCEFVCKRERERERECKLQPVQQLVSYKHKARICKRINVLKL